MLTRRSVLAALAAAALDPDRMLWRPGARLISIPRPRVPFLAVGDIVTFGEWPDRYVVTTAVSSEERIMDARFACVDQVPRMFPTSIRRVGDTVFRQRFRDMMTLTPKNLRIPSTMLPRS